MTINRNLSILAGGVSSTGVLGVPNGGSGATTLTGYLIGNGASAFTASATIPTSALSGTVSLTTQVSGILPVGNGGTGLATLTAGYIPYGNGTGAFSSNAAFLYDASGNVQIGNNGGASKLNIFKDAALSLYNTAATSLMTIGTGQIATITNYFSTGSTITFSTNANGGGILERIRLNPDGVFYVGGTTSKNNELFNVKGTAVTQTFSSNGNAAINTILDSIGVGGGICIIRGSDGFSGQSFSRAYIVSVTVSGGAASTLATLLGSAGGASTTGFTFAFAAAGGFVTVTGAGFGAFGGQWHVSFVGL
jgi:hypothetical protein